MDIHSKEKWSVDPQLKHWVNRSSIQDDKCGCGDKSKLIELLEHDFCVRGRIDTTICTRCDKVRTFKIIR